MAYRRGARQAKSYAQGLRRATVLLGMRHLLALLLTVGCAAAGAPIPDDLQVGGVLTVTADAELQADVDAAVDLWARATDGAYLEAGGALTVHAVDTIIGCPGQEGPLFGCTRSNDIEISRGVAADRRVSVIAHEFGHTLRLPHADSGLMNPHRSAFERLAPCVSAELAAEAGMPGPGACL